METNQFVPASEELVVPEHLAVRHAAMAMCEHAVFEMPSLVRDVEPGPSWFECILGEPNLLYDISGPLAVYAFPVLDLQREPRGRIFVAANKLFGSTIVSVQTQAEHWDLRRAMQRVCCRATEAYPGWIIERVAPVIHDFPQVGVMAVVADPRSDRRAGIIMGLNGSETVPICGTDAFMDPETSMDGYFAWSRLEVGRYYERAPLIEQWEKENRWALGLMEYFSGAADLDFLHGLQLCHWLEPPEVEKIITSEISCEKHVAPVRAHYLMSKAGYCTVAVARMIASRYNVFDSESYVASVMGIPWPDPQGSSNWATAAEELVYYKNRLKKANSKAYSDYAFLSNPNNYKNEIVAGRPSNLRKWSIKEIHHSRLLGGIRICQKSFGQRVQLGMLSTTDILSPFTLPQHWDQFDNTPLTTNGVVSTNLLIGGLVVARD